MRKAAHEGLNKGVVKDFHGTQTKEALILASDGLSNPTEWDKHLRRAAASMVLSVVYDQPTIKAGQDHNVKLINDFVQRLTRAAYPGAHLVEFFPWMRYIPSRFAFSTIPYSAPDPIKVCDMEAKCRGLAQARLCHVRRSFQLRPC